MWNSMACTTEKETLLTLFCIFSILYKSHLWAIWQERISCQINQLQFSVEISAHALEQGACDHLVEMLMFVDTWGKTFATVPIPDRTIGDVFRFISSDPNTVVNITGGISESFIITKPGGMVERSIPSNAYCLIEADKAIMTVQFVHGQTSGSDLTDPSMMIVQPLGGYSNTFTFTTLSRSTGAFINYVGFHHKNL